LKSLIRGRVDRIQNKYFAYLCIKLIEFYGK
jgi:hypothetical protein